MKKLKQTYLRSGRVIGAVLLLLMIVGSNSNAPMCAVRGYCLRCCLSV